MGLETMIRVPDVMEACVLFGMRFIPGDLGLKSVSLQKFKGLKSSCWLEII